MKFLLAIAILGAAISASASPAKLLWTHDYRAVDGSLVTITGFKVYWGVNGQPNTNVLTYGPPAPIPYKVVNGMYYYAKTFDNPLWTAGTTVCFQMSAVAGTQESDRSGQVCKVYPLDPTAPVIIEIDPK